MRSSSGTSAQPDVGPGAAAGGAAKVSGAGDGVPVSNKQASGARGCSSAPEAVAMRSDTTINSPIQWAGSFFTLVRLPGCQASLPIGVHVGATFCDSRRCAALGGDDVQFPGATLRRAWQ